MATSVVSIYNLALQKLGAARVAAIDDDTAEQRHCTACYEHLRDAELRSRAWVFSITRAELAASATVPLFGLNAAYPLPSDCLRPLFPQRTFLDWQIESTEDGLAILTNDGAPLQIRYIARVTDPTRFDESFVEMLACKMADHMCEAITQSNTKKVQIQEDYKNARNLARQMNAFEMVTNEGPEDSWLSARRSGSLSAPWLSRQNG